MGAAGEAVPGPGGTQPQKPASSSQPGSKALCVTIPVQAKGDSKDRSRRGREGRKGGKTGLQPTWLQVGSAAAPGGLQGRSELQSSPEFHFGKGMGLDDSELRLEGPRIIQR